MPSRSFVFFWKFEEVGSRPSCRTTGRSQAFLVSHARLASGIYGSDQWRAVSGGHKGAAAEEIASTTRRTEVTRRAPARKSIFVDFHPELSRFFHREVSHL